MRITFDVGTTGLSPGFLIYNSDGTVYAARSTAGVSELPAGSGVYGVDVAADVLSGRTVVWDTGEAVRRYGSEFFPVAPDNASTALILDRVSSMTVATRVMATLPTEGIRARSGDRFIKVTVLLFDSEGVAFDPADHGDIEPDPVLYDGLGLEASDESGAMWVCYKDSDGTPLDTVAECHHTGGDVLPQVLERTSAGTYFFWMNLDDAEPLGARNFLFGWFDRGRWDEAFDISDHRHEMRQMNIVDFSGIDAIHAIVSALPSSSDVAAAILDDPSNLLAVDSGGGVRATNILTDEFGMVVTVPHPSSWVVINQDTDGLGPCVDQAGNPLANVLVTAYVASDTSRAAAVQSTMSTVSGAFELPVPPGADYVIVFAVEGQEVIIREVAV